MAHLVLMGKKEEVSRLLSTCDVRTRILCEHNDVFTYERIREDDMVAVFRLSTARSAPTSPRRRRTSVGGRPASVHRYMYHCYELTGLGTWLREYDTLPNNRAELTEDDRATILRATGHDEAADDEVDLGELWASMHDDMRLGDDDDMEMALAAVMESPP